MAREQNKPTDWREEIGKAIDSKEPEVEVKAEEVEEKETPEVEEPEGRQRDETGKFKAKEEKEEKTEVKTDEVEKPVVVEKIDPPAHFTADEKKFFESLAPEQQQWIASSVKRMSSTVDKRMQELSTHQRRAQAFDEVLSPYRDQFALQGMDDVSAVRFLTATYTQLQKDPANTIKWLAQQYGVNLNQQEADQDPQTTQVMGVVQQLQKSLQETQQTIQQERYNNQLGKVNQFAAEKDAQGNARRPHFEAVVGDMMKLIKGGIVPPDDLQTAYDRAVLFHPELTPVAQPPAPKPTTVETTDVVKDAAEKAARAKKAAAGVKSGAGSPNTQAPKSQRDTIADLVEASMK
jgi:hypothetical protein